MELVRGRTLDAVIPPAGLPLPSALRYATQIVDALAAAHAAGIVHRDLKPGNIMVTEQDQIKVLDFGLATLAAGGPINATDETGARAAAIETGAGTILGTVAYMSPEQAEGQPVDARSDIFSFGAIFYEMLSGLRAFRAGTTFATLAAVVGLEPEPLTKVVRHVPPQVEQLVTSCLRKDASRRAQSTSDLKIELDGLREASNSGSLRAVSPRRFGGWGRPLAIAAAVLAVVAAIVPVAGGAAAYRVHAAAADVAAGIGELPQLLAGREPGRVHLDPRSRCRRRRPRADHRRRHADAADQRRRLAHVPVLVARRRGHRDVARAARNVADVGVHPGAPGARAAARRPRAAAPRMDRCGAAHLVVARRPLAGLQPGQRAHRIASAASRWSRRRPASGSTGPRSTRRSPPRSIRCSRRTDAASPTRRRATTSRRTSTWSRWAADGRPGGAPTLLRYGGKEASFPVWTPDGDAACS